MPPPVVRACVSSPFGPRVLPNKPLAGTFHNGIDLAAPVGSPVTAVGTGTVIRIHRRGVGGLEILIQHDGFIGVYSHLGLIAPVLLEGGKAIYRGERIATVGRSGLTYGAHLSLWDDRERPSGGPGALYRCAALQFGWRGRPDQQVAAVCRH